MAEVKLYDDMTVLEKIDNIMQQEAKIFEMGGPEAVQLQHDQGKYTARERIERLYDPGTFVEIGTFCRSVSIHYNMFEEETPADGVIAGYGLVYGRPVYGVFQDATVMGGTIGKVHARKIVNVMKEAANNGCPMVYFVDSEGLRFKEGPDAMYGLGTVVYNMSLYSGRMPQICVVAGPCTGAAALIPGLADWIFAIDKITKLYANDPATIKAVTGEEVKENEIGGARVHATTSANVTTMTKSEDDCIFEVQRLLGFLPGSVKEKPPRYDTGDSPDRYPEELRTLVPDNPNQPYDMKKVISAVVDNGDFMEWQENWARNIVCALARMDGGTVGILAQNTMFMAGCLDVNSSDKGSRFIRFCDAYNIPILNLVDVPGYLPGTDQEWGGIIRHGAKMLYAYSEATVPKITVVTRKSYGGSYLGMCSKDVGADIVIVWPPCEMAVMGPEGAVDVLERDAIKKAENPKAKRTELLKAYRNRFLNPTAPAAKLNLDKIIDPAETRSLVCKMLKLFENKDIKLPYKRQDVMPE
jgi:acetyl-CoA carboxylase carboxyltransferase component